MLKYSYITFLSFIFCSLSGQMQNPSSVKWIQMKTPHYRVVAPKELEGKLIETANLLEHVHRPVAQSMYKPEKKLNVFLYNQSTISNGYVSFMPVYSAYYSPPPQNANLVGGSDWFQTLSLHEYRHYIQQSKLNNGFNYVAHTLLGDLGKTIFMNVSTPAWFFEGDAICSETALSAGGRGRLPSFTRDIRAIRLDYYKYKYDIAYLGSYKDYVPNHYYLGYLMSASIRKQNGLENWNKVVERTAKKAFWPYAFGGSLKKYTGARMGKTYKKVFREFDSIWVDNAHKHLTTHYKVTKPYNAIYTNYKYPYTLDDGSIICLKTGLATPPVIVQIEDDIETGLLQVNPVDRVHSNGKQVIWASPNNDIRWGQRSFTDIIVYDIEKQVTKTIVKKSKYFAPALSPSGDKIAIVEFTPEMECSIVVIDALDGSVISKHPLQRNYFARMPSWSEDEDKLIFTQTYSQDIVVSVLDLNNSTISNVTDPSPLNITSPVFLKKLIVYNSPELGVDVLVALDTNTKEKFVVASGEHGVYELSYTPDGNMIAFQDYSTKGFGVGQLEFHPKEWLGIDQFENVHDNYYEHLVEQEQVGNVFEDYSYDSVQKFEIKKYRPLFHSVKIHSWMPRTVNNGVGLSFLSSDYLNTMGAEFGAEYYPSAHATRGYIDLIYSKLFPMFIGGISYGRRYDVNENSSIDSDFIGYNETAYRLGVGVPLDFSKGIWQTSLFLGTSYNYISHNYINNLPYTDYNYSTVMGEVSFSTYLQSSYRDLNPRYGIDITLSNSNIVETTHKYGSRQFAMGNFYFPGFAPHHSTKLKGGIEYNNDYIKGIYDIESETEFVNGYNKPVTDTNYYENVGISYSLPLVYPDFAVGPLLYIKRITMSGFYDFGKAYDDRSTTGKTYNSIGADINFDVNFFRNIIPFNIGFRTSYLIERNSYRFEFLLLGVPL